MGLLHVRSNRYKLSTNNLRREFMRSNSNKLGLPT